MSTESEPNKDQDNNKNKNEQSTDNKEDIKELLKIQFVKDLLVKIDVLKNGLISERQKTLEQTQTIKELKDELSKKEEQINVLIKDNLEYEKNKKEKEEEEEKNKNTKKQSNSFMANEEISKLNEELTKVKLENEKYQQKMNTIIIDFKNEKDRYELKIKALTEKNNSLQEEINNMKSENQKLEGEINNLKKEKETLEGKIKQITSIPTIPISEKERLEALLREYKKDKEGAISQLNACLEKCSKLALENTQCKDKISLHEIDAKKMALKLAEYKNSLIKVNLRTQVYHVKKVGLVSSTDMDIIFGIDENGNYIIRLDEKGNSDIILIQDVESFTQIDKNKNKVKISYMYKAKKYNIVVLVHELVVDQFVEAYKNFYSESMKTQL